jgi:cytochrome P450
MFAGSGTAVKRLANMPSIRIASGSRSRTPVVRSPPGRTALDRSRRTSMSPQHPTHGIDLGADEARRAGHDFDPVQPGETFTSAHEEFAELRRHCPIARSQTYGGFWAALGYAEVLSVITDIEHFTTSKQNAIPKFAFTGVRPPLHLDPPEHMAYRRVINAFFTRPKMRAIEPKVRAAAVELLDPLIDARWVDVCKQYAHKFPAHVFAHFFNLSVEVSEEIKRVSGAYVDAIQVLDHESSSS